MIGPVGRSSRVVARWFVAGGATAGETTQVESVEDVLCLDRDFSDAR